MSDQPQIEPDEHSDDEPRPYEPPVADDVTADEPVATAPGFSF